MRGCSVQYALEELGKILIFREKLDNDKSDPLIITYEEAYQRESQGQIKTEKVLLLLLYLGSNPFTRG